MINDVIAEGTENGGEAVVDRVSSENTPRDEPSSNSETKAEVIISDSENDDKTHQDLMKQMMVEISSKSNKLKKEISNKDVMREDIRVVKEMRTRMKALRTTGYHRKEFTRDHPIVYNDLQIPINPKILKKRT
jgi:hypothetical protein